MKPKKMIVDELPSKWKIFMRSSRGADFSIVLIKKTKDEAMRTANKDYAGAGAKATYAEAL